LLRGAKVIAIASPKNHAWLKKLGAIPVDHDPHTIEQIRAIAPSGRVDAWVDVFGGGYVDMASQLGVQASRINTTIDFEAAARQGAKTAGTATAASSEALGKLAALVAEGKVEVPIAARYPLEQVRDAFKELERRHTRGKIVLVN
jgi:NADPH:quinone reductase-like Zn-dependent oxidoreductase